MATAVQPSSEQKTPSPRTRLVLASLFGAVFVIAGVAVAAYLVPTLWRQAVSPVVAPLGTFVDVFLRLTVQLAAIVGVVWLGTKLVGANPPKGLRGGIFLAVVALLAVFFLTRWLGLAFEDSGFGLPLTLVTLGVLLGLTYYGLTSPRAERWMHGIEEQGWFHAYHYKASQGKRYRRLTMIGILVLGWTGVYTLVNQESFGRGDWSLRIPYTDNLTLVPLTDIQYTAPVLLAVATFWVAWRAVNMPVFADFLVATEAEMNKVSWSSRKRLVQDTIVVLSTLFLLTAFLFAVDWFWGTVLSWKPIGVLPSQSEKAPSFNATEGRKVDW